MRVRLTRNIDKERGFGNGALAEVEYVLRKDVFVVKTPLGVRHLVHPVTATHKGVQCTFVPACYGYAMTIRRSQGSTLDLVALWFDHSYPCDRGYAYVGASRVRSAKDLCLMGKVRRTDWLPVGGNEEDEQSRRGSDSEDSQSNSDQGSEDMAPSDSSDSPSEDQVPSDAHTSNSDESMQEDPAALFADESSGAEDASDVGDAAAVNAANSAQAACDDTSGVDHGWVEEGVLVRHP